jgi:hypothetical protein
MYRELLETLFQQNYVDFSCIKLLSEENVPAVDILTNLKLIVRF